MRFQEGVCADMRAPYFRCSRCPIPGLPPFHGFCIGFDKFSARDAPWLGCAKASWKAL